ncbi:MAG TPA: ABC transporter transmembrane domain-containing protein [Stellaceae bacterium]|nr:ABC transporter transmembrane domain-containing protein [Stellaceae bacterium]
MTDAPSPSPKPAAASSASRRATALLLRGETLMLAHRLWREFMRGQWPRISLALIAMAAVAAATAANAWLMEPILDKIFVQREASLLWLMSLTVLGLALVKGFAGYFQAVLMYRVGQRTIANIQHALFQRLIGADLAFFHDNPTGTLVSRFTNDAGLLRSASANVLVGIGRDAVTAVFLVALMFYQDWALALASFLVFPLALRPIASFGSRMRRVSATTQSEIGAFTTLLDQTFQGMRHVKAYGMEAYETSRAERLIETLYRLMNRAARTRAAVSPMMEALGGIAVAAVILYGGYQVIEGVRSAGTFFSFMTALLLAYQPIKNLANLNVSLQEGLAAAHRLFAILDVEPAIRDNADAVPLEVKGGEIRLESVCFSYPSGGGPALNGLELHVPAGGTVALVGASGAGKSTILNLIPRFYDVGSGRVLVDGTDVRQATLASLRSAIALVSQEVSLFDDTVRANIAYGRFGAGEEDIVAAAQAAAADEFIRKLPQGYDTLVGEQGIKLSGGQRQRLAIARAMLKNAPILLLDEATSSLDTESERQVQSALKILMRGRTTLVVAHRLSTVVDADLIYVIDGGRVIESGTHAQLMARGGAYRRLYALQFAKETAPEAQGPRMLRA